MSSIVVLRKKNGSLVRVPASSNIIEADGGVYISYDVDASEFEFQFKKGWEVMGTVYGEPEFVEDPSEDGSWISEI